MRSERFFALSPIWILVDCLRILHTLFSTLNIIMESGKREKDF